MSLKTDTETGVHGVLAANWNIRSGIVVPTSESITLRDGAVKIDATYLYADLADSTGLVQSVRPDVAAKVIRSYLNAATRILRHYGGQIRSFDGDRVMAVFIGDRKNTNAVRAALALNWAVVKVLHPKFVAQWINFDSYWTTKHGVGIDTGEALLVRGGVRNDNDLVSVGHAPNIAAKLSELRGTPNLYISRSVYDQTLEEVRATNGTAMWSIYGNLTVGANTVQIVSSTYHWEPST